MAGEDPYISEKALFPRGKNESIRLKRSVYLDSGMQNQSMKLRNIKEDVGKISNADTLHLACKD